MELLTIPQISIRRNAALRRHRLQHDYSFIQVRTVYDARSQNMLPHSAECSREASLISRTRPLMLTVS